MVSSMQAAAVVIILAALAYILYLWSKRRHQIRCPECGAWVDIRADACPDCGHTKADVTPSDTADLDPFEEQDETERYETGRSAEEAADEPDVDYDEIVSGTIPEVKDAFDEHDLDPAKVLEAETANKDRVTLKDWLESRMD